MFKQDRISGKMMGEMEGGDPVPVSSPDFLDRAFDRASRLLRRGVPHNSVVAKLERSDKLYPDSAENIVRRVGLGLKIKK